MLLHSRWLNHNTWKISPSLYSCIDLKRWSLNVTSRLHSSRILATTCFNLRLLQHWSRTGITINMNYRKDMKLTTISKEILKTFIMITLSESKLSNVVGCSKVTKAEGESKFQNWFLSKPIWTSWQIFTELINQNTIMFPTFKWS